jgi:hypothetical protein
MTKKRANKRLNKIVEETLRKQKPPTKRDSGEMPSVKGTRRAVRDLEGITNVRNQDGQPDLTRDEFEIILRKVSHPLVLHNDDVK